MASRGFTATGQRVPLPPMTGSKEAEARARHRFERLPVEERRRLGLMPDAFGKHPLLEPVSGAMTRAAERWRATRFAAFARRWIEVVRGEPDEEYESANDTRSTSRRVRSIRKFPAALGVDRDPVTHDPSVAGIRRGTGERPFMARRGRPRRVGVMKGSGVDPPRGRGTGQEGRACGGIVMPDQAPLRDHRGA
jgi:hypothetical protein